MYTFRFKKDRVKRQSRNIEKCWAGAQFCFILACCTGIQGTPIGISKAVYRRSAMIVGHVVRNLTGTRASTA